MTLKAKSAHFPVYALSVDSLDIAARDVVLGMFQRTYLVYGLKVEQVRGPEADQTVTRYANGELYNEVVRWEATYKASWYEEQDENANIITDSEGNYA